MTQTNFYLLTLKSGKERMVSRVEEPNKTTIGLWKWAQKQMAPIIMDFQECSVKSDEIVMIDKAQSLEDLQPEPHGEIPLGMTTQEWINLQRELKQIAEGNVGSLPGVYDEAPMTPDEWEEREKDRLLKAEAERIVPVEEYEPEPVVDGYHEVGGN